VPKIPVGDLEAIAELLAISSFSSVIRLREDATPNRIGVSSHLARGVLEPWHKVSNYCRQVCHSPPLDKVTDLESGPTAVVAGNPVWWTIRCEERRVLTSNLKKRTRSMAKRCLPSEGLRLLQSRYPAIVKPC